MANYNHAQFLEERIRSILSQMSSDDELIIVDDASKDISVSIIEKWALQDSRIRFLKNEKNIGVIRSANIAVAAAKGTYLVGLAADDYLLPGFIDKTMQVLLDHPEIGICCSDCARCFDGFPDKPPDQVYTDRLIENTQHPQVFPANSIAKLFRTTHFWVPGHTAIMKRELIAQHGGFQESLGPFCDWFLLHAIALNTGAGYVPEELSVWRQDVKSYSNQTEANHGLRKQFQRNLFKILYTKEFKHLRRLFRISGVLHYHIRQNLFHFCLRPRYWSFLFSFVRKYLGHRWRRGLSMAKMSF